MQVQINFFSEQDQENLYMATQAGKSAGKKGLGKSTQGKPIGGAKWEGTKKAFDGDEEAEGAEAAVPAAEAAPLDAGVADAGTQLWICSLCCIVIYRFASNEMCTRLMLMDGSSSWSKLLHKRQSMCALEKVSDIEKMACL